MKPDCKGCRVELLPENNVVDYLMQWYGSTFTDRAGDINSTGIKNALESEDIENKTLVTKKLIIYLRAALDTQNKEHTDGGQDDQIKS